MGQIDSFGEYVRQRLDEWGREFALHRDCDYLGHQSKNMLQVLIEHKGEMPGKAQGYKPLEVDLAAQQIEDIVADIARDEPRLACVLRAYFCGRGRRKVERRETALLLIANVERDVPTHLRRPLPNERRYMDMVSDGIRTVRGALLGIARAA
jgi:hypothetical protein